MKREKGNMGKILHISDFHFGINKGNEESKLRALAEFLRDKDIEYIVYTGDIIDARTVVNKCRDDMEKEYAIESYDSGKKEEEQVFENRVIKRGQECIAAYNRLLEKHYHDAMSRAESLFAKFFATIKSVKQENIVFCCGNHDRLRRLSNDSTSFECKNNEIDENVFSYDFKYYDHFCRNMVFDFDYHTTIYRTKEINFIILNSNWRIPKNNESNNMCINCTKVADMLKQLKEEAGFDVSHNILIAHKPFDDICENVKCSYKNEIITLKELIQASACAFLYGDKHSYGEEFIGGVKTFMSGAPLASEIIRYNLIDFECKGGIKSSQFIYWDKNRWRTAPGRECIAKVYSISKKYLTEQAFYCLALKNYVPAEWFEVLELMDKALDTNRFSILSDLFLACSEGYEKNDKRLNLSDNLFVMFTKLLSDDPSYRPITIKGESGTGKSTFLIIEYIYLLMKFYNGTFEYMPFYFNFEQLLNETLGMEKEHNDIANIVKLYHESFERYLQSCFCLADNYKLPICVLVDGLEQKNLMLFSDVTLEYKVYKSLSKMKNKGKYVMSFNTHNLPAFDDSFGQINSFNYVFYMNDVDIIQYKSRNQQYIRLIKAFLKLQELEKTVSSDDFLEKILKLRKISINLKFLLDNQEAIFNMGKKKSSWDIMLAYKDSLNVRTEQLFDRTDMSEINRAAYLLYNRGKCFQEIIQDQTVNGKISYQDFVIIRDKPEIAEYLIANYFVQELNCFAMNADRIPQESILNCFITRNTAIMIRLILTNKNQRVLLNFIEKHSEELKGYLYSMIVYIIGHIKEKDVSGLMSKLMVPETKISDSFFHNCEIRSYEFANVVSSGDSREKALQIICKLMRDENYRKFNRTYQLYYYDDIRDEIGNGYEEKRIDIPLRKGFDYHNCFLVLVAKLRSAFLLKQAYPLLEIDLFTLCDFTYSRLQLSDTNKMSREQMLFYGKSYNKKDDSLSDNILTTLIELLDEYLDYKLYETMGNDGDLIRSYFQFMKKRFESIREEHVKSQGITVLKPYVSLSYEFEQILELETMRRVGWNINHAGDVKKSEQMGLHESDENIKETMMQHIMESVYIAQIFLPDYLEDSTYSKSQVISLLLMSELGRIEAKDYVPQSSDQSRRWFKKREKEGMRSFLILGSIDGYANQQDIFEILTNTDITEGVKTNINLIICREIQMIQMEYKYYTLYSSLDFDEERRKDFEEDFSEPSTAICRKIRRKLITENPSFAGRMKKRNM